MRRAEWVAASGRILGVGALLVWLEGRLGVELWWAGGPALSACVVAGWSILLGLWLYRAEPSWFGLVRQCSLAAAAGYAVWPFLDSSYAGGGDAYDYALQAADFASQLRHGIWPIFVGQSAYGFIGTVHTLRTAPAYTHLVGLCDALTLHRLPFLALIKLALLAASLGGVGAMYFAGRKILGEDRANLAAALAGLYVWSAGVLAPLYLSDMYSTYMAVPWLPLLMTGWVMTAEAPGRWEGWRWWGTAIGGLWWAHAPTAAWALLVSALVLAIAWRPRSWRAVAVALGGCAVAAALSLYVFVSVESLQRAGSPTDAAGARAYILAHFSGWSDILGPRLQARGAEILLGWQIGLPMLGASLIGLAWGVRRRVAWAFFAAVLWLGLLLGPWPAVGIRLWRLVPDPVVALTSNWPAQRFAGLLSILCLGISAVGLRQWCDAQPARGRARFCCVAVLLGIAAGQVAVYQQRILTIKSGPEASRVALNPERVTFGRANAEVLGNTNPYLSEGHMDPAAEFRSVDLRDGRVRADGMTLRSGAVVAAVSYELTLEVDGANMAPQGLALHPGGTKVSFDFHGRRPDGILELKLPGFTLDFNLPNELHAAAGFGAGTQARAAILLQNPDAADRPLQILFWPRPGRPPTAAAEPWATVRVEPWEAEQQRVRLRSLLPTVVEWDADRSGWLESPKLWIPGYAARIDGWPSETIRSAHGLVAVAVPAGRHTVTFTYPGSLALRVSYVISIGAWLTLLVAALGHWIGRVLYKPDRAQILS